MEDSEIYAVLESFKLAIDTLQGDLDELKGHYAEEEKAMKEQLQRIESTLFDEILTPAREALEERTAEDELASYREKYGEKLAPYGDELKNIEGEDFDFTKHVFDNWKKYEVPEGQEGYSEDVYVDKVIEQVSAQLQSLKDAVGAPDDAEVDVKVDENGKTEVAVDGEVVEEKTAEEPEATEEEKAVEEDDLDEAGELSEDEMKALEEEMKKEGLI